jgi:hypothetical protein
MKETFNYLEQLLSIMEECDPNAERSLQICSAFESSTGCYRLLYQKKTKASVQLSLYPFFEKADKMPSASTSSQR